MKPLFLFSLLLLSFGAGAQTAAARLNRAWDDFEKDGQLQSAIASLYVINATTGEVIFDRNGNTGLAPASTQKVITAATAYALLGRTFRYVTDFGYTGPLSSAMLVLIPSGDPTLGSWRWKETRDTTLLGSWARGVRGAGIKGYSSIRIDTAGWPGERIPDGWIWQDIGNYYGAGAGKLNWRENQFDLVLSSGEQIGDEVVISQTVPVLKTLRLRSVARAAARGTGDNAYVYYDLGQAEGLVRGTIPAGEKRFVISAAHPQPERELAALLEERIEGRSTSRNATGQYAAPTLLYRHHSPPLDSISYWFLRRSINLYGEALLRTLGAQQGGSGTAAKGLSVLQGFWKDKGIAAAQLRMVDGSGLSPLNRVTTRAQVAVLQYARQQAWFPGYFAGFPEYNGMKMKSGTINGAKGFCGYHTSAGGVTYVFSFLVNNYNGSASQVVQKMYTVLNGLK
jgi:D-alanyl-D-alanine carboxypeptidase/D-alanyl-D-alanine-endopeptidase (penicillin-binding protein 4)